MFCEKCGSQLPDGSKFCMNCGAKAAATENAAVTAVEESAAATDTEKANPIPDAVSAPAPVDPEPADVKTVQPPAAKTETVIPATQTSQPAPASQPAPQAQTWQQPAPPVQQPAVVQKPEKVTPLSVWKFIGIMLLQAIPVIGFIMILVWSFGSSFNRNTKNYARAVLILGLIQFVLIIAFVIVNWAFISYILESMGSVPDFGGGGSFGGIR